MPVVALILLFIAGDDCWLVPSCNADMVLLDAHNAVEAIRLRATRLKVIRRGKVVAETPMQQPSLTLLGRSREVSFSWPPPGKVAVRGHAAA